MTSTAPVRHKTAHHLSSRTDAHGWVESISNLTENTPATELMLRETESVHQVHLSAQLLLHQCCVCLFTAVTAAWPADSAWCLTRSKLISA